MSDTEAIADLLAERDALRDGLANAKTHAAALAQEVRHLTDSERLLRADVDELLACLRGLSQHFIGQYEHDPRSDDLIQKHREAAEFFARTLLSKHALQALADNARELGLDYEDGSKT